MAAHLLQAFFDKSAYGVKLYCCWCAQDLEANRFWEAMGFKPIAFRTGGGRTKNSGPRMHIFWQKRIREGDDVTPWYLPSKTGGGAIGEDRLVLPFPTGTHWRDAKPVVLPEAVREEFKGIEAQAAEVKRLGSGKKVERETGAQETGKKGAVAPAQRPVGLAGNGLFFGPSPAEVATQEAGKRAEVEAMTERRRYRKRR